MEKIKFAAIKRNDNCIIYGKHHGECIQKSPFGTCVGDGVVQGFLTSSDRFVNRKEAYIIAKEAMQFLEGSLDIKDRDKDPILISEMLWDEKSGGFHNYSEKDGYVVVKKQFMSRAMRRTESSPEK